MCVLDQDKEQNLCVCKMDMSIFKCVFFIAHFLVVFISTILASYIFDASFKSAVQQWQYSLLLSWAIASIVLMFSQLIIMCVRLEANKSIITGKYTRIARTMLLTICAVLSLSLLFLLENDTSSTYVYITLASNWLEYAVFIPIDILLIK